jgi:hypothetical protein
MRILSTICVLCVIFGCNQDKPKVLTVVPLNPKPYELPVGRIKTDNPNVEVQKLFTDAYGCTILRFQDEAGWHYYALGPVEPKGKDLIQTLKAK